MLQRLEDGQPAALTLCLVAFYKATPPSSLGHLQEDKVGAISSCA